MIRSAVSRGLSQARLVARHPSSSVAVRASAYGGPPANLVVLRPVTYQFVRAFSSSDGGKKSESADKKSSTAGEDETKEIVLTPGQKVVAASRLSMWAGILAFASVCGYYIIRELLPTKMSPNSVFNSASDLVKNNPQVKRQYGEKLKVYGRDHGGHREGRRNFIEHTEYTSPDDNSKRTRVRFNLEGQFNNAFVFAEQSSEMPAGTFVYVLVQDKSTGRVITVVDNRASMTTARLTGGNKESSEAMQQLLSGGKSG